MLSLSLGLRANILPAFYCISYIYFYFLLRKKNYNGFILFGLGLTPCLIMPIHNYYFTKKIIPLTIAAYKDWNLGAKPMDYIMFIISLFKLNVDICFMEKNSISCFRRVKSL